MKKKKKDIWKWDVLSFIACIIADLPSCLLMMPLSDIISRLFGKAEVSKCFFLHVVAAAQAQTKAPRATAKCLHSFWLKKKNSSKQLLLSTHQVNIYVLPKETF